MKQVSNLDIKLIRLSNGNELIGNLITEDQEGILVESPLVLTEVNPPEGLPFIILQPYMIFTDQDTVLFKNEHILNYYSINSIVEEYYLLSTVYANKLETTKLQEIKILNEKMSEGLMNIMTEGIDNTFLHKGSNSIN